MEKINNKAIAFLPVKNIEKEALEQIINTSKMPFLFKHVAVMPDCHCGARSGTPETMLQILKGQLICDTECPICGNKTITLE